MNPTTNIANTAPSTPAPSTPATGPVDGLMDIVFAGLTPDAHARIVYAYCKTYGYFVETRDDDGVLVKQDGDPAAMEKFALDTIMDGIMGTSVSVQKSEATDAYEAKIDKLAKAAAEQVRAGMEARVVRANDVGAY